MVSGAEAKEIAGKHVDKIVGGPDTGYSVQESTSYGPGGPYDVTIDVWRVPEERDNPAQYLVEIDEEDNITNSEWNDSL